MSSGLMMIPSGIKKLDGRLIHRYHVNKARPFSQKILVMQVINSPSPAFLPSLWHLWQKYSKKHREENP